MHILDLEACDALTSTEAKALKVDQVCHKAVQCVLNRHLKERILALGEAVENAYRSAILLTFSLKCQILDRRQVCKHCGIN